MGSRSTDSASAAEGPRVGIVTVVYRSDDVLPAFMASVPGASREPTALVVVDNSASADSASSGLTSIASAAAELTRAAGGQYVPLPSNPGYGGGMNAGVTALPGSVRWVLISNPDVELEAGAIDILVEAAERDATIAAVGPTVMNADGTRYPSARSVPSLRTGVGHALFVNFWQTNPWTRRYRQDEAAAAPASKARDAGWLSGSCVLVRRDVFVELGGFDEGYFMYFEDVDLGYRIGKAGYRNRYEPAARVMHSGAHATTQESGRMVRAHHASARRFLARKYRGWWLWPVRAALAVGLAARSAMLARRTR